MIQSHQFYWSFLVRESWRTRSPYSSVSMHQMESSFLTYLCSGPSIKSGSPLMPTFRWAFWISTVNYLDLMPSGMVIFTVNSWRVCSQVYLSALPPLPELGACPFGFSSLASSPSPSLFSSLDSSAFASRVAATPGLASRASSWAYINAASSSVTSTHWDSSASYFALASASLAARSAAAFAWASFFLLSISSYFCLSALKAWMCLVKCWLTVVIALSSWEKKSVLRAKKENMLSKKLSIPSDYCTAVIKSPSNLSLIFAL